MASLNKVQIIGNLGKDPEVRMTGSGQKVANFSVAVTEKFKNRDGQQQEKTEWVNIVFWGRQAEICEQYLRKGSSVYIEGKLETSSWDDNNGQKRYKTEIRGFVMQMLGGKSEGQNSTQSSFNSPQSGFNSPQPQTEIDDSLPF